MVMFLVVVVVRFICGCILVLKGVLLFFNVKVIRFGVCRIVILIVLVLLFG